MTVQDDVMFFKEAIGNAMLLKSTAPIYFGDYDTGGNYFKIEYIDGLPAGGVKFSTSVAEVMRIDDNYLTIGTGATPDASSLLTMESTTRGFLPPRMTTAQKNAIGSPTEGLCVYDTTLHKYCVYTGAGWETVTSA